MRPRRIILLGLLLTAVGCTTTPSKSPYQTLLQPTRSAQRAREANEQGLHLVEQGDAPRAEASFRQALAHDPGCAAAHGNLGLILLEKRLFYEAAIEFSLARKLAPRAIEPRLNLARLYQCVGWHRLAISECEAALELEPDHPEVFGRLAEATLRLGKTDPRLDAWLAALARQSAAEDWHTWAEEQLATRHRQEDE